MIIKKAIYAACLATVLPTKAAEPTVEQVAAVSASTPKAQLFRAQDAPAIPTLEAGGFSATPSFQDDFSPGWEGEQTSWRVATWKQNGTQMAPERCRTNGEGMLVQTVLAGEPFRGGSMQTNREFGYGRWVARVKPSAVPGLINSIFTKDWDNLKTPEDQHDGGKAEVDFEFVTHTFGPGRGEVHLAIHLKDHTPLWHLDYPLEFDPSADFHEWGFDILPDRVVWHVDGKVLHTWNYTKEHRIDPEYEFFFNSWTRVKWLKGPPEKDGQYLVDWVKFYPLKTN